MRQKIYEAKHAALHEAPPACCPLCRHHLDSNELLHTADYRILIRRKHIAEFTSGEASVFRALFEKHGTGFRVTREWLIESMYRGSYPPLHVDGVLSQYFTHIRRKLVPLEMGLRVEEGVVTLLFFIAGRSGRPKVVSDGAHTS